MNFIELNIRNSRTTLQNVDPEIKLFKTEKSNVIVPVRICELCGIPESLTKLYNGLCKDCAKHYIDN
jgi:hypothetical protein